MTPLHIFASLVLTSAASSVALAAQPISADSMGLSKGSVFKVPAPKVYITKAGPPGTNQLLPRAYPGALPQIPHDISNFLPIAAQNNICISCHNIPGQWGKTREPGMPTPMPATHYTDLRSSSGTVSDQINNARFNCNQCHVPQMDAKPLVENTFGAKRTK